jgi:Tol biopolymer transport system component
MNARPELERLVNDWLAAGASVSGSDRVLAAALERVATTRQERHATQRLFGERLGRSRTLRVALIVAAAVLLLAGVLAAAGSFLRLPAPPLFEGRNGWIAYSTSVAGHDIYLATEAGIPHRLVGSDGDGVDQGCQRFGRDGRTLAYVESTFPSDTAESWSAVVLEVDANGGVGRERARLTLPGPLTTCPRWSPDLTGISWVTSPNDGGDLELAGLDGTRITLMRGPHLSPPEDDFGLEVAGWSPDGTSLAVLRSSGPDFHMSALWIVPTDGSQARELVAPEPDRAIGGVSWSPDGYEVGFSTLEASTEAKMMLIVDIGTGETRLRDAAGHPGGPVWSPDGTWIAYVSDGRVVVSASDGSDRRVLPPIVPDVPAFAGGVTWAPDGTRLVVTAGDATFVDRGVHFTVVSLDPAGLGPLRVIAPWKLGFYTDLDWQAVPR